MFIKESGKRIDSDGFSFREVDMQGRTDSPDLNLSFNRRIARRIVFGDPFDRYLRIFPGVPDDILAVALAWYHNLPFAFTTGWELS